MKGILSWLWWLSVERNRLSFFGRETYEEYLGEIFFDFGLAVQVER